MAIHIQTGKQKKVAIVFSCPGRREEEAGFPAAKTTGKNLDNLLMLLSRELKREDLIRDCITITNAWPIVEYREKTGRSEATEQEVKDAENIERLKRELDNVLEFVIFCGDRAKAASESLQLKERPKFIHVKHLGTRGLLSIQTDINGNSIISAGNQISQGNTMSKKKIQAENTEKRLLVIVRCLLSQLSTDSE